MPRNTAFKAGWRGCITMRRLMLTALASLLLLAPAAAQDSGLVVGSGNFFSPIVANLDKAVAFYRDDLGLGRPVELPAGRGTPIEAAIVQDPDNLFLVLIQSAGRQKLNRVELRAGVPP